MCLDSGRVDVEHPDVFGLDPEEVVQEEAADDGPGLIGPGLLPDPRAGGAVKVFSPLLTRQLIQLLPVALLQHGACLAQEKQVIVWIEALVHQHSRSHGP